MRAAFEGLPLRDRLDGVAGFLLRDPLDDDAERPRLVPLLPDLDGFAVVCARELTNSRSIDSYRPLGEPSHRSYWER